MQLNTEQAAKFDAIKKAQNLSTNTDVLLYLMGLHAKKELAAAAVEIAEVAQVASGAVIAADNTIYNKLKTADLVRLFVAEQIAKGANGEKITIYTVDNFAKIVSGNKEKVLNRGIVKRVFEESKTTIEKHNKLDFIKLITNE